MSKTTSCFYLGQGGPEQSHYYNSISRGGPLRAYILSPGMLRRGLFLRTTDAQKFKDVLGMFMDLKFQRQYMKHDIFSSKMKILYCKVYVYHFVCFLLIINNKGFSAAFFRLFLTKRWTYL